MISRTFLIGAQSERLPLTRRRAGEDLHSEERLDGRAAVALASRKLTIKLNNRMHVATGSIIARACMCETYPLGSLELHAPQLCSLVCMLRPAFVDLVPAGNPLFQSRTGRRVFDELRAVARSRGWDRADKLGTLPQTRSGKGHAQGGGCVRTAAEVGAVA